MENFTLQSGRIYKFEVWGAKGGNGAINDNLGVGGAGGNGSHAVGWYDLRTSASLNAQIFAGGAGGTNGVGWGATAIATQLQGTPGGGGVYGGGGGGASGIYVGATAIIVAGGGGGGGGGGRYRFSHPNTGVTTYGFAGGAGGGINGSAGEYNSGGGGTQTSYGAGNSGSPAGTASGGGAGGNLFSAGTSGSGGGAGGGYARGFAGGGGRSFYSSSGSHENGFITNSHRGTGGGGSGGSSYIGGVQSLKNSAKSSTWAYSGATGNGKVVITEYIMAVNVASPTSTDDYLVSAPSKTSALFGESYTFTITREVGVGDVGLVLNSTNGSLELTNTNGNVFTYTVSNVQGQINANDFSVTTYNVEAPPNNIAAGYTISNQSTTSVLKGGSYSFIVNLEYGYAMPMVTFSGSGIRSYSGVDEYGNMTVTISNVQGAITAADFTITVFKV